MYDYVVIGGGIVGVSTAWQLQSRFPNKSILLIEKEATFSCHQTGHNSGVVHAGVYYAPGSLKAKFCKAGVEATKAFCAKHNIALETCGKLLVATSPLEEQRMKALFERCLENGLDVELLDEQQLKSREPNIAGLGAIYVATTSIVDYRQVTEKMALQFANAGGTISLQTEVIGLEEDKDKVKIAGLHKGQPCQFDSQFIVVCSGLMADRMTRMMGIEIDFQIVPYRGEYYRLPKKYNDIVNHLVYPIPDPDLPFLGVHLTKMIDGSVTVGPNAVQGWKREGYGAFNFSLRDVIDMLSFAGFWKVSAKHFKTGLLEAKDSWWKPGYLKRVNKYCPQIQLEDLQPYPAGIRAQAVLSDGTLVHDFLFAESARSLHVCNAPSPAATSAIPIGGYVCDKIIHKQGKTGPESTA